MNSTEKEIFYRSSKSYSTLNTQTPTTKNIWFVCHGMGYLSRYFIRYFKGLDPVENYIIAPQAPSKYYQDQNFKHIGASWLTRENTLVETENIMRYFDAIFEAESLQETNKLIVLGYSQGLSVAMRYIAKRKINCQHLIMHSGGIPKELIPQDLEHFSGKVSLIYGTNDHYINEERIVYEISRAKELFGNKVEVIPFDGDHMVNVQLVEQFAK